MVTELTSNQKSQHLTVLAHGKLNKLILKLNIRLIWINLAAPQQNEPASLRSVYASFPRLCHNYRLEQESCYRTRN